KETYYFTFDSDLKLIKDPVKKILFPRIKHWILHNKENEKKTHFKEGHYWTFGTYDFWAEECGLETKTVGNHLRELVTSGILKSGNFNKKGFDKTIWYRLATSEELKNVNFRLLYYGKSKEKNADNHSNETLLWMYQNGMLNVENKEDVKENLGLPIPEYKTNNTSNHITNNILDNNADDINNIKDENDILKHIEFLSKNKLEDIPNEIIRFFINKFHKSDIDSIQTSDDLFYFKCNFDVINHSQIGSSNINFCFNLINKYHPIFYSPQPAEQK
ncbi:MAG: hypothetical protein RI983_1481, partial [Bacteroidota bacterium]